MAYRVVITAKAETDLDAIVDYIAGVLSNPPAAAALLDEIEAAYSRLADRPMLYPLCRQPLLSAGGYRKAPLRGYLMLYRIDPERSTVYIARFFSDLEDYMKKV